MTLGWGKNAVELHYADCEHTHPLTTEIACPQTSPTGENGIPTLCAFPSLPGHTSTA
jgi:hypothetical protein